MSQKITITDDAVTAVTVQDNHRIYWVNDTAASVTLSNLPRILTPAPANGTISLAAGVTSGNYTVAGPKGQYTYAISAPTPKELPKTGTIDIG